MTGEVANYFQVLSDYREHLIRSLVYAGLATIACIVMAYPLAYAIAFKAGRWKNLMLVAVIAPHTPLAKTGRPPVAGIVPRVAAGRRG